MNLDETAVFRFFRFFGYGQFQTLLAGARQSPLWWRVPCREFPRSPFWTRGDLISLLSLSLLGLTAAGSGMWFTLPAATVKALIVLYFAAAAVQGLVMWLRPKLAWRDMLAQGGPPGCPLAEMTPTSALGPFVLSGVGHVGFSFLAFFVVSGAGLGIFGAPAFHCRSVFQFWAWIVSFMVCVFGAMSFYPAVFLTESVFWFLTFRRFSLVFSAIVSLAVGLLFACAYSLALWFGFSHPDPLDLPGWQAVTQAFLVLTLSFTLFWGGGFAVIRRLFAAIEREIPKYLADRTLPQQSVSASS
jgi:hypothetical protein